MSSGVAGLSLYKEEEEKCREGRARNHCTRAEDKEEEEDITTNPPSPSSCPAAPCNTPNIRKKKTSKKRKIENNPKSKVVRFANQEKDVLEEAPDFVPLVRKPYWSSDVEVTHLEFSEQNYRRSASAFFFGPKCLFFFF